VILFALFFFLLAYIRPLGDDMLAVDKRYPWEVDYARIAANMGQRIGDGAFAEGQRSRTAHCGLCF
jgi:hypothetical protein